MKKRKIMTYALWILLAEAVGALAAWLTRRGSELYSRLTIQPPASPPPAVFPIVWAILYALMGIGAARVVLAGTPEGRKEGVGVFLLQLGVNFLWSIIFFNFRAYGFALIWLAVLWLLILWMILLFRRTDKTAARLQIPYLLWVSFALYLNAGVWLLNR